VAQAHDALVKELDPFALVRAQHRRQIRIGDDVDHTLGPAAVKSRPRLAAGEPTSSLHTVAARRRTYWHPFRRAISAFGRSMTTASGAVGSYRGARTDLASSLPLAEPARGDLNAPPAPAGRTGRDGSGSEQRNMRKRTARSVLVQARRTRRHDRSGDGRGRVRCSALAEEELAGCVLVVRHRILDL